MDYPPLHLIREDLGWSQERMAREVGVSLGHYAACERGTRPLTIRTWRQIQRLYLVRELCRQFDAMERDEKEVGRSCAKR